MPKYIWEFKCIKFLAPVSFTWHKTSQLLICICFKIPDSLIGIDKQHQKTNIMAKLLETTGSLKCVVINRQFKKEWPY